MKNSVSRFMLKVVLLVTVLLPCALMLQACSAQEEKPGRAKPLSFEAVTFTGENPSFTLKYPKAWVLKPVTGKSVLYASAADDRAADSFSVFVADQVEDPASTLKNGIERLPAFVESKAIANIRSVIPGVMADGRTESTEIILTAKVGTYDVWFYCYAFNKGGKTICFVGDTMGGESSKALIREIAHTLAAK